MNDQPHASWADVYDLAYSCSFGDFYNHLTDTTVEAITARIKPPASIIDFGAGTGRLSIPLAQRGYAITAVDPCQEMLNQLRQKEPRGAVQTVCSKMEDFSSVEEFDVALCVFTVILYLLDKQSLQRALATAYASLKFGGILLIDIPSKAIFHGYSSRDHLTERSVSVVNKTGDIFNYTENLRIKCNNGKVSNYQDEFLIRYWPPKLIIALMENQGFILEEDLSSYFSGTGSNYYIMKKAE
jgi:SAM-dependent methyltransferase